jgi:DNA-nicking Smr family endonuclease
MSKKPKLSQEDIEAFQKAVQGIKPLPQRKVRVSKPKTVPVRKPDKFLEESSFFDGGEPREYIQADDFIEYKVDGVSHKTLRKLGKGQYNVEAQLDLHRKTIEEARVAVNHFLHECIKHGIKSALIVHGKGRPGVPPALKNQLNYWLRQASPVLAFCSAAPSHGGKGAVYILLKSHTEEKFA